MVLPQRLVPFEPGYDMMHKSIEMGRALSSRIPTKPMPLFLLWKNYAPTFALSRTQIFIGRRKY
jgi:hypothetical protein